MSKIGIKFVDGGKVYNVETNKEFEVGKNVVVESIRGIEIAKTCEPAKSSDEGEIKTLIRLATDEDIKKSEELARNCEKVIKITNDLIAKYKLDMKLVDVQFTLDGGKVIINYVCEDRVDFRELVKDLASTLKLRIELRQIGIRDQAKKIGGIGFCGKECCCKKYLNDFDKVSIKMAKTQGLSLNPSKISGICGRLMCCLSYENEFYSEVAVKMPKLNSKVKTPDGTGTVIYNNLLKQTVTVRIENENETKVNEYSLENIIVIPKENVQAEPKRQNDFKKEKSDKNLEQKSQAQTPSLDKVQKDQSQPKHNKKKFKKFKKHENDSKAE
ncbi:MAG: stage 0 sporulation protein [Firmicutes bacterium]|nr:stage 0 sporulation protein [Bacillota bacterium]